MPAWNPLLTLSPRPLALLGALAIWLGSLDLALAQGPYGFESSGARWPTSTNAAARNSHSTPRKRRMRTGRTNAAGSLLALWRIC